VYLELHIIYISDTIEMKVAVIGGGPSGLVTLKYLLNAHLSLHIRPIEARLFENEDSIGGTFYARTYEDAEVGPHTPFQPCPGPDMIYPSWSLPSKSPPSPTFVSQMMRISCQPSATSST